MASDPTSQDKHGGADGASRKDVTSVGPTGLWGQLTGALSDIKLAHSVFALPFAVLAAFIATPAMRSMHNTADRHAAIPSREDTWRTFAWQLGLIVVCMVLARTWAMLVNRLADRRFDADNPRTAGRVFASGQLSSTVGWRTAVLAAVGFLAACAGFIPISDNFWPIFLGVPVLIWIAAYSYTKRFTALCHLFLGGALAASPLAATIAVDPSALASETTGFSIALLSGFVLLWVAGFDVAYALADITFDRRAGLFSIPAAMGLRGALWVSRALHAGAFTALVFAIRADPRFGVVMWIAVGVVGSMLIAEHGVLAKRGVAGLPIAFFTLNGCVSVVLGVAGCLDIAFFDPLLTRPPL